MGKKSWKTAALLLAVASLLALSACSAAPHIDLMNAITSEEEALIEEKSEEIVRCLTEGDKKTFASLFCEDVRESDGFAPQVDAVFDFFVCDVYIRSRIETVAGGGMSKEGGERTEWYVSPEIPYIEVLQYAADGSEDMLDRYYGLRYHWQIVDAEHPEKEGLQYMELYLLNLDRSVEIGDLK